MEVRNRLKGLDLIDRVPDELQLCPTPSDPTDCSLPGSSVHGICQARVLEWGAIAFSLHKMQAQQSLRLRTPRVPEPEQLRPRNCTQPRARLRQLQAEQPGA